MARGKELARRDPGTVQSDSTAAGLRQVIQEALLAYETAVATRLQAERETNALHAQHARFVAALEQRAAGQLKSEEQQERGTAAVEAQRIETLAQLAAEAAEAAVELLNNTALAQVRGAGEALTGPVQPHTATDELVATAFTTAQTAAVDLRAAILRLAGAHLENRNWESARSILVSLQSNATGPLGDEATAMLYSVYLGETVAASEMSDWDRVGKLVDLVLELFPDKLTADHTLAELYLRATGQLVDAALAANRPADAAGYLTSASQKLGANHPELRRWTRANVFFSWKSGLATCLQEFGGHSQPVQSVAFTADGEQLVSADGSQIKRWGTPRTGSGRLISTIPAPNAYQLTGEGRLAICANGKVLDTSNGHQVGQLAGTPGRLAGFAGTHDAAIAAWTIRGDSLTREMYLKGKSGYTPTKATSHKGYSNQDYYELESADHADYQLLAPLSHVQALSKWVFEGAIDVSSSIPVTPGRTGDGRIRPALVRLIKAINIGDPQAQTVECRIAVAHSIGMSIAMSSAGEFIAWLDPSGQVILTDIHPPITRHRFQVRPSETLYDTVTISPDDGLVAAINAIPGSSNSGSTITVWDIATGRLVCSRQHNGIIGAIAFSPDERFIAGLNTDGEVSLDEMQAGSTPAIIGRQGITQFPCLAFSPDGSRLVTSGNNTIKVWGVRS